MEYSEEEVDDVEVKEGAGEAGVGDVDHTAGCRLPTGLVLGSGIVRRRSGDRDNDRSRSGNGSP